MEKKMVVTVASPELRRDIAALIQTDIDRLEATATGHTIGVSV